MDKDWNKQKLMGNNAEDIIEYLINSLSDWKCFRFGIENHIIEVKELIKGNENPISKKIRKTK